MNRSILFYLICFLLFVFSLLGETACYAQTIWEREDITEYSRATIGDADFWITGFRINPASNDITFKANIKNGGFTQMREFSLGYTVDPESDSDWQAYREWIANAVGYKYGLDVTAPADPMSGQAEQSFQEQVFDERPRSDAEVRDAEETRTGEEDEEEGGRVFVMRNEMTSDVEFESFDLRGDGGSNAVFRAGYSRNSTDYNMTTGINFNYSRLSFDSGDNFNNYFITLFTRKALYQTMTGDISLGVNVNYLQADLMDKGGAGFGGVLSAKKYFGGQIISGGAMYQYSKVEKLAGQFFAGGLIYGFPLGDRLTFTFDALAMYNASRTYNGISLDINEPFMAGFGGYLGIYVSRAFGINMGVKTLALNKDYFSVEYVIGAGLRF